MLLYNYTILAVLGALTFASVCRLHLRGPVVYQPLTRDELSLLKFALIIFVIIGHCDTMMTGNALLQMLHCGTPAVAVFLFLSGYGLVKAEAKGGVSYVKKLPISAAIKLLIPFFVASCLWLIYLVIEGMRYNLWNFLLPLTNGSTFLPHAWYVYTQFLFYLVFYVSYRFSRGVWREIVLGGFCLAYYVCVRYFTDWDAAWSYTSLSFPLGVAWASNEQRIIAMLCKHNKWRHLFLITPFFLLLLTFIFIRFFPGNAFLDLRLSLIGLVVLLSLSCLPRTKAGAWLGSITFEMYLLHCLPKVILLPCGKMCGGVLYCLAVILCTIGLAAVVHPVDAYLVKKVRGLVFRS